MIMWKTYCTYTAGNCKVFLMIKEKLPQQLTATDLTKGILVTLQMRRKSNNVFVPG